MEEDCYVEYVISKYESKLRNLLIFDLRGVKDVGDLDAVGDKMIELGEEMKRVSTREGERYERSIVSS